MRKIKVRQKYFLSWYVILTSQALVVFGKITPEVFSNIILTVFGAVCGGFIFKKVKEMKSPLIQVGGRYAQNPLGKD